MRTSLLVTAALPILGQHGVHAFTSPVPTSAQSRICQRNRKESEAGCIKLYSTKIEEQVLARDDIEKTSSTSIQYESVVDTTGIPTPISLGVSTSLDSETDDARQSYRDGLTTICFITLLFASNSPALHSAFSMTSIAPPVLLINAAVTVVGLTGVVLASPFLGKFVPDPSNKLDDTDSLSFPTNGDIVDDAGNSMPSPVSTNNLLTGIMDPSTIAGSELGLWKTLGTTANIYGLSLTSSDHGAFLIQLTTLIVPMAQGLMGVPIPTRIWSAIGLALGGVFMFTQDPTQSDSASLTGDLLCALAAIFYATYDLRLFKWGKLVPTDKLITTKMVTQSLLSFGMLSVLGYDETLNFISQASQHDLELVVVVALWSGLAVNCVAPYLQVSGQQAVGPARAQIMYASQPLWASIMSFFILGEQFGTEGYIGGSAFLGAMFLAATAEMPDPNCSAVECEV